MLPKAALAGVLEEATVTQPQQIGYYSSMASKIC